MMETEQRMLKGFVTAASLSSEDIDAMDKSVSELWCSASDRVGTAIDAFYTSSLMTHSMR